MKTKVVLKDDKVLYGFVDGIQANGILSFLTTEEDFKEKTEGGNHCDIKLSDCKKIVMTNVERAK